MNTTPSIAADERRLQQAVDRIANQLCQAVSGDFDIVVKSDARDESLEKLEMLINFVLDAARRGVAALQRQNDETNTRMQAVVDAAADGVLTLDQHGTIESFNRAACEMFGYAAEEVIGKNFRMMVPPDEQDQYARDLQEYLHADNSAGRRIRREVLRVRKDGSTFPIELHLSTLRLGGRLLIVSVIRDIADRRQADARLAALTDQLVEASRQAGMAELATGVLHNVGNVLNSVNVSTTLLADKVRKSKVVRLAEVANLLGAHAGDLGAFFTSDEKGKRLPFYIARLAEHLAEEQAAELAELNELSKNVEHVKKIVKTQQANARVFGVVESVSLADVINDALTVTASSFERYGIHLERDYAEMPPVAVDKQRLLQILVNLVRNAKHAVLDGRTQEKRLVVRLAPLAEDLVRIDVVDNGVGIPEENLTRIFSHGFTTKKDGHGFGLHSSALAAKELGGTLTAHSDGREQGATFTLVLPVAPAGGPRAIPLTIPAAAIPAGAAT